MVRTKREVSEQRILQQVQVVAQAPISIRNEKIMNNKSREILLIAQEECAEVTQAISKIFRFGLEAKHPQRSETNKEHLSEEIGDLLTMIDLMVQEDMISWKEVLKAKEAKLEKLKMWSNIIKQ